MPLTRENGFHALRHHFASVLSLANGVDIRARAECLGHSDPGFYPGRPPGFEDHEDIGRGMHAGRRQRVAYGGQPSVLWRLTFHRA